jgi:hypothetical protein
MSQEEITKTLAIPSEMELDIMSSNYQSETTSPFNNVRNMSAEKILREQ